MYSLVILWSTLLVLARGHVGPTQTVKLGNDLFAFCDRKTSQETEVYWESQKRKFHQEGASLTIANITRDFTGEYDCYERDILTNVSTFISSVYVDVLRSAQIVSETISKDILEENETFSVEVNIQGNPQPYVQLIQSSTGNDVFNTKQAGVFNISFVVQCFNTDRYFLTCANDLNYDSVVWNLSVKCAPKPDPTRSMNYTYTPRVGAYIKLQMFAIGYPLPNYTWHHGDTPVKHVDTNRSTTVDLRGIKSEDFGNYTLTMKNEIGTYTQQYTIIADGPPDAATDLEVGTITIDSAQLSWSPGFDYGNKQTFTVVCIQEGKEQDMGTITLDDHTQDRINYTVSQLEDGTTYMVQIKSHNSKGDAVHLSNKVQFETETSTTVGPTPTTAGPTPTTAAPTPTSQGPSPRGTDTVSDLWLVISMILYAHYILI